MSEPSEFLELASRLGAEQPRDSAYCLASLSELRLPRDMLDALLVQLAELLPTHGETDRCLANLTRFLQASRSPQAWLALFEREPDALRTLVQLFSASQYLADILIADPEVLDLLRMTGGQPVSRDILQDEIVAEVQATADMRGVMRLLRDYRHREMLRIAYGDIILGQSLEIVTGQLTILAESILQAAVLAARREVDTRRGPPLHADGRPAEFCVLALGKLGGRELNYSSDIDLVFVHESVAERRGPSNAIKESQVDEYFQRVGQQLIKLLSESTARGIAYRVDMRLRPYGGQGPLVISYDRGLQYYDSAGRTWERQAFIKARPVAGDISLGESLLQELQPWIYRRYLMRADITGLAALKRRIERRGRLTDQDQRDIKTGFGGIRDIETVIQFLQLLHGGEVSSVRTPGTLDAIERLHKAGCLTGDEQQVLQDNYRFLRRVEHFLQIMDDRQAHSVPEAVADFAHLAKRLGFRDAELDAAAQFRQQLQQVTQRNRRLLDHLLHEAFAEQDNFSAETDLILDPEPSVEVIEGTLGAYKFEDAQAAYRHLQALAVESIPFLSTRRCRHFLSAIAPKLLAAIANTPNPDATLIALAHVSDSLGGKAGLWELFSANPPSLDLCVRLCAASPYLTSILTSNPGMIDELMDSLMLDALPTQDELTQSLDELCRGAVDIHPILQSFKNSMHLRVGVRDILGKSSIAQTHKALSDIAEVCLEQVIHHEFHRLVHQLGIPSYELASGGHQPAELVVLAVGKLGGREPNYHSDLDVIFLFDVEGQTRSLVPNRRFEGTTNRHFFNQLCQRVIHAVTRVSGSGRLFDLDVRLRPLGRSGELAITFDDLQRYFADGAGQVWEKQALCKARPIWGSQHAQAAAMRSVHQSITASPWSAQWAEQILTHRQQLEKGSGEFNLKRGSGGTMDVEFSVQVLQLANAHAHPCVLVPGTVEALQQLGQVGLMDVSVANELKSDYEFLRGIESGIRLMNMTARHELPKGEAEMRQLAYLLSHPNSQETWTAERLREKCQQVRQHVRTVFDDIFNAYLGEHRAALNS
jgi:[glutamine synthetase] adenylyltransferase / [glutamine synthetase]-adenylyl-L-tyrosine phosphorylase